MPSVPSVVPVPSSLPLPQKRPPPPTDIAVLSEELEGGVDYLAVDAACFRHVLRRERPLTGEDGELDALIGIVAQSLPGASPQPLSAGSATGTSLRLFRSMFAT